MPEEAAKPVEVKLEENLQPLPIAPAYANQVAVQGSGTDVTLIFSRLQPVVGQDGRLRLDAAIAQPSAVVQMSPQTAKDLVLALGDTVNQIEKEFGKLSSPFSKKAEAPQK